jgi:hypothetical protein
MKEGSLEKIRGIGWERAVNFKCQYSFNLLLKFILEYAIRGAQANKEGLKLNGTH